MEYRTWISLKGLPFAEEARWLPLMELLESEHGELGPVAPWDDERTMVLTLSHEERDRAAAAERAVRVLSEALHATGLGNLFPEVFQVEAASDALPV